jgi:hypothetical protein
VKVLDQVVTDDYAIYNGDCVEVLAGLPDESVGMSVFSPPFASLYTYSASPRDMGNCRDSTDFAEHFRHLVPEILRVLKPGRLVAIHCMQLPTTKVRDGYIGLIDFRGQLIRAFQDGGFILHSEVTIWKDPVQAMQRTKALGLLHKTIRTDSSMSRQGIADYLVIMRKPGKNPDPITHTVPDPLAEVDVWQRYASPVWAVAENADRFGFFECGADINPGATLQRESAREEADEKHICPLQLPVIERAIHLWSNPGDVVLSPFTGIGSEGFVAVQHGRKFVGAELKESYFRQAVANLAAAVHARSQVSLFGGA